jgi:hypothetical protein
MHLKFTKILRNFVNLALDENRFKLISNTINLDCLFNTINTTLMLPREVFTLGFMAMPLIFNPVL